MTPKTPKEILEELANDKYPTWEEDVDKALTLLNQYYEQKVLEALPKELPDNYAGELCSRCKGFRVNKKDFRTYNNLLTDITEQIKKVFREGA